MPTAKGGRSEDVNKEGGEGPVPKVAEVEGARPDISEGIDGTVVARGGRSTDVDKEGGEGPVPEVAEVEGARRCAAGPPPGVDGLVARGAVTNVVDGVAARAGRAADVDEEGGGGAVPDVAEAEGLRGGGAADDDEGGGGGPVPDVVGAEGSRRGAAGPPPDFDGAAARGGGAADDDEGGGGHGSGVFMTVPYVVVRFTWYPDCHHTCLGGGRNDILQGSAG